MEQEEVNEKRGQINTTEYNALKKAAYKSLAKSPNADPAVECPKPADQRANQPLLLSHMSMGCLRIQNDTLSQLAGSDEALNFYNYSGLLYAFG